MPPDPRVVINSFPGLQTNVDPNDKQPGAAEKQVNVTSVKPGQLSQRGGMRRITFEN